MIKISPARLSDLRWLIEVYDWLMGPARARDYTFAALPAGETGMVATVTDSNTAVWGAAIAGGGANTVLAFYNGAAWTVAGK